MKTTLMIILALIMLGCGEDDMAHIGEEITSELIDTNVTDDTEVYNSATLTTSAHISTSSYIVKNGTLWSTGDNTYGQLGLGDSIDRDEYTDTGVADVKSVIAGFQHAFIIKNDGTLWGVGSSITGQLGLGNNGTTDIFAQVEISDVRSVFAGTLHSIVLKNDGTIWGTGNNTSGELGLGDNTSRNVFVDIGIDSVKDISSGNSRTIILKTDGTIWGTGSNTLGQLGLGDNLDKNTFTLIDIDNTKSVHSGAAQSFIIKNDESVYSTGYNVSGQLGLGDNSNRNVFTSTGVTNVKSLACGSSHTALLKNDGTVWTTGGNWEGQLGLNDTTNRNVFTDTGVTSTSIIVSGHEHTLILKTDETLWATGMNDDGQLGLGDAVHREIFTDTSETPDTFIEETWATYYANDIVRVEDYRHIVSLLTEESPSMFVELTQIGVVNELKPFDGQNITPAISSSPMTYKITSTEEFNAFTLAKVLATSVTYTFRDEFAALVKTETIAIDCKRDENGTLSLYPTTVIYYADQQMPIGSTVEISIANTEGDVELGDFVLNNTIDYGFTNLTFTHRIKDFNDYTPDAWGNIPEAVKAIVTNFDVTMDFPLSNYDHTVSFNESISGKNVTIDASDSNGAVADGESVFNSLTRRVRVTNVSSNSVVKDGSLDQKASSKLSVQEIV